MLLDGTSFAWNFTITVDITREYVIKRQDEYNFTIALSASKDP